MLSSMRFLSVFPWQQLHIVVLPNWFHSKMLNVLSQIIKAAYPFGSVLSSLV